VKLRRTTITVAAAFAAVGLAASPAYAWDCIRVSGSAQGLQQSSAHGQWAYMTIDDLIAGGVQEGFITREQVPCVEQAWSALGEPTSFAIGSGVAGARGAAQSGHLTDADFFELAKNAPLKVMIDGKGVDHLDDALMVVVSSCSAPSA
jgi:hypothetical protein